MRTPPPEPQVIFAPTRPSHRGRWFGGSLDVSHSDPCLSPIAATPAALAPYRLSLEAFEKQLDYLSAAGFVTVSLEQ